MKRRQGNAEAVCSSFENSNMGIGTTTYGYVPINAGNSTYGDGAMASIDGPWTDDTITYEYDQLGRVKKRSINGVANEVSAVFDDTGRVTSVTNNLGTFDYAYVAETRSR